MHPLTSHIFFLLRIQQFITNNISCLFFKFCWHEKKYIVCRLFLYIYRPFINIILHFFWWSLITKYILLYIGNNFVLYISIVYQNLNLIVLLNIKYILRVSEVKRILMWTPSGGNVTRKTPVKRLSVRCLSLYQFCKRFPWQKCLLYCKIYKMSFNN